MNTPTKPGRSRTPRHSGLVMGLILCGYLLILVDVSVVMTALPRIHADLHFSATGLSWVQNAYTLVFGGLLLLGARAGDLIGRRRMFIAGIGVFTIASLAVGLAQDPAEMIVARAVQGIGAALLAPSTLALLSTEFPEGPARTRAMAAYGAAAGIGVSGGLILGGVLTSWVSWRVAFFINVPVGLLAIVAAPRMLDETPRRFGRLDAAGAVTSTLGIGLLVYGVVNSATAGWTATTTLLALMIGAVLVAAFVAHERRAAQPLMPLRLLADRQRAGAYAARFLFNGALLSFFFFMTQYLQGAKGDSPILAAVAFLPQSLVAFATAALVPRLSRRLGNEQLLIVGIAAMLGGLLWISRASSTTAYATGIALPMAGFGIGQGLGLSTLTHAGMAGVSHQDAGIAGGLVNAAHHLGGAVGLGILTTVFASAGSGLTGSHLLAQQVTAALLAGAGLATLALIVALVSHPRLRTPRRRSPQFETTPRANRTPRAFTPDPPTKGVAQGLTSHCPERSASSGTSPPSQCSTPTMSCSGRFGPAPSSHSATAASSPSRAW